MQKSIRHESKDIRLSARGQECQVRIPGVCNSNPETTVLAHVRQNTGMGLKGSDFIAAFCCSSCHDEVDRRTRKIVSLDAVKVMFYEGVFRTQQKLADLGLIRT